MFVNYFIDAETGTDDIKMISFVIRIYISICIYKEEIFAFLIEPFYIYISNNVFQAKEIGNPEDFGYEIILENVLIYES